MAVTLIAGLAAAGSAWAAGGFAIAWSAAFGAFAIGAGLSLVSRALMPKPDLSTQMGGQSVTTREAAHSRKIVYGRARIGGNIVYLESTGTDNKYLYLVIAVAGHEIDAYESVWFNDKKVWDGGVYTSAWATVGNSSTSPYVDISFYKGDQQAADSGLVAASTKWTTDHKLLDTAYMVVKLTHDTDQFAQGLPNISTIIRGKKVYDPDPNVNATAWSQNPALCLYDYLRETKYGLGEEVANILTTSVTAAKIVCDEAITTAPNVTQPRYTIDGVVDSANSIKSNIEAMIGSMAGRLIYSGGKFEIHAGEYVAPAYTVDESQVIGEITVRTKQSRRNAYNGVKGVFLSEEDNYILADYPAQISSSYALQDGDPMYLDMPLPYTSNNIRAQRLAKLALFRSRQQEAITIPCNLSALRFKIGDNINVTNARLGYNQKVFEIVGYSMDFRSDGQILVNVDAIETAASIWDWQASDAQVFLGAGEVALYTGTTAVAPIGIGVTSDSFLSDDGTFNSQFKVTWTNAVDAFTDHYVVEWKLASDTFYFSQTTKSTPFHIVNLVNNASYNVRVKAVNELGVSSAYLSATETSAVDTTAPSAPTSVSAKDEFEQATISWVNPTVDDFSHVDVYGSNSSGSGFALIGTSAGTTFTEPELGTGVTRHYKLKAVDYTGNASVFSSVDSATTTQVPIGGIADNAVDTDQIADDAVDTGQIADEAVEINQIAASLQSTNYSSGSAGWKILKSGVVEFEEATIRGSINANNGEIGGFSIADTYLKDAANTMGLSSVASSEDDVRFWAGNTFANRATAPFFVTKGGALKATKITVSGPAPRISIGNNSADTITITSASNYRMWVGNDTPENAKFSVHKDGTLTAKGMHLQDGNANAYFSPQGFTDLAYSEIAANTASRVSKFESNLVYNLQSVKVTLIQSTSLTLGIKASNLFSGLDLSSVTIGSAQSMANALADIPDNFTLKIQKSTTAPSSGYTDVVSQTYTKVTTGSSSATNYRATSAYFVPSGTTNFATPAEVDVSNYASVTGLDESGDRTLENTATYAQDVYYFRVQLTTTDASYDTSLNNLNTWPRSFLVEDNGSTGFNVISANEVTQAAASGDITGVEAGTNLNGGGASGDVILNLDSTITGDHTFSNNLIIGGDLTVQGTTTTVDTDDLNVKDKNITLNYSTGDSSGNANGAGITIQDAVNSTTNATILWDSTNDKFDFSHKLTTPSLDVGGAIEFNSLSGTGSVSITDILDQDNMSSNSATALATQQSIKAYVDTSTAGFLPLSGGTLTGGLSGTTASFSSTASSGGGITSTGSTSVAVSSINIGFVAPNGEIKAKNTSANPASNLDFFTTNSSGNTLLAMRVTTDRDLSIGRNLAMNGTLDGVSTITANSYKVGSQEVITSGRLLTNIASYNGYDPSSSSSSTNSVISLDSRSVNSSPSARNKGLYVDFKNQSTIGLTGSGTYAGVLTFRAYGNGTDLSGGYPIQIAYDEAGALQARIGSSATAWGSWKAILTSGGALSGTSVTSTAGSITSYGALYAGQGGIYTNSVERITNAGNLTNIGTISSGKIMVGSGASAQASINAYTATVSSNLFSALRIIENTTASSYWDIGATGGSSTALNFYHNATTTPKISFSHTGTISSGAMTPTASGSSNTYASVIKTVNTSSDQWGHITLGGSATNDTINNYYLIGRGGSVASREMSFHVPIASNYGDSTQPKFRFASTGADTLMTITAQTGAVYIKGTINSGSISSTGNIETTLDMKARIIYSKNTNNTYLDLDGSLSANLNASGAVNLLIGGATIFQARSTGSLLYSGGLMMGPSLTEVISANRDIANIGTITNASTVVSKNLVAGLNNGTFSSVKTIGALHIANLAGSSGAARQSGITFQGNSATEAQAGIYVTNDNSTGTHMAFATTNSYATGPQFGLTISNVGVVNIPRNALQFGGNTAIDANRNLTVGTISSGTITSSGDIVASNGNVNVGTYSTTATGSLYLNGSTASRQARLFCSDGNLHMDAHSGNGMYLNYYNGSSIVFGNGASGSNASILANGNFSTNGTISSGAITAPSFSGASFGAASGAPNSTIWAISRDSYPTYGIFYVEGTPDKILYKWNGVTKFNINMETGALDTPSTITGSAFYGDGSNLTGVGGTTINNNADNRIITGSGTANTLNAESGLTYDGTTLSGNAIQMSGNINASQVGANNILGNIFKIGTTTVIDASRIFYAQTRVEIQGSGGWAYTRLRNGTSVMWDIAANPADNSSALQFRPSGGTANATLMSTSGNWTTGADNHTTYGPNSTWGSSLRVGGNGRTATGTEMASVVTTDGNLHLDPAASSNGVYLNYYAGTNGVIFGNGAGGSVGTMSSAGLLSVNSGYRIGTTTVIDASRNVLVGGNLHFNGTTSSSFIGPSSTANIRYGADGIHQFDTYNGGWVTRAQITDTNLNLGASVGFQMNGTTVIDASKNATFVEVSTGKVSNSAGGFLLRGGSGSGVTRHISLWDSTSDPSSVVDSEAVGITWGSRSDNNPYYLIYPSLENINGNYTKLNLSWHTGIKIGASSTYGGTRFFNNSTFLGSEIFSVGNSDNHIRILQGSLKMGQTTVIDANRNITAGGVSGTSVTSTAGSINSYGALYAGQGGVYTNNVERITNAGNLTNIGTITATTFNATGADTTPAGTAFQNTMRSTTSRVLYLDGTGSTSLWQGSGNTAHSAIDTNGTYQSFWANNGSGWQEQMRIYRGSVRLLYSLTMGGSTVIDASRNITAAQGNFTGTLQVGGGAAGNSYDNAGYKLLFGGGNSDSTTNYYIGTNLENVGGNYSKLDLRWHTGIRMGAQGAYGGIRFYSTEDLTAKVFSICEGSGSTEVKVYNNLQVDGNVNASQVGANNILGNVYKIGSATIIDSSRNFTGANATFSGELISTQGSNNYMRVESSGSGEAMIRYNNTVSQYWYIGLRNGTSNSITNTGYHIYSAAAGQTVAGWNADRNFYTSRNASISGTVTISGSHSSAIGTPNINSYGALSAGTAYNYHMVFRQANGTVRGQITNNVYGTQYGGASDYRLKENIQPLSSATSQTLALNPCTFNWIEDADNTAIQGFVAHEVAAIVPEAVVGEKDALDADGNPDYQTIDQSKLIPILVKTIQELEARITALESA